MDILFTFSIGMILGENYMTKHVIGQTIRSLEEEHFFVEIMILAGKY